MTLNATSTRTLWSALLVASALTVAHPAIAQDKTPTWGSLTVQSKASSSERVSYFRQNLHPHDADTYADPNYHKTIVKLNWYDDGEKQSRIVNLKRTFDIYGLFEGTSITLTAQAKAILDDLGTAITSQGINSRMYAVAGHTVATGEKKSDQTLSTQRANVVRAYLMEKFDIAETRLTPVGFGSHNLKNKKTPAKTENNRIEICMIEDLYEKEPKTSVQLPDVNSKKPLAIKIVSLDTKKVRTKKSVAKKAVVKVAKTVKDDDYDAELEHTSQTDAEYVARPKHRKRIQKRFSKRFNIHNKYTARRYKRRNRIAHYNTGWNTAAKKRRKYRSTRIRNRARYIRRNTNPYCPPW